MVRPLFLLLVFGVQYLLGQEIDYLSAPWTPIFAGNQSINYRAVQCSHKLHAKNGVNTVWLGGNMAQWTSMTNEERFNLFVAWTNANKDSPNKLNILAQVGSSCLETACSLTQMTTTKLAKDLAGLAVIGPAYLDRPATIDILVDWLVKVDACQAGFPHLPLYYYHIPGNTGINFKMAELVRALSKVGINLGGIKFVDDDVLDFRNASQFLAPFGGKMYWAPSPKLRAMPFGARRFVLAEDFMGPYMQKIATNYLAGNIDNAALWEVKYQLVMNAIGIGSSRAVDGMLDPACDVGPPRLPLVDITPAQRQAEKDALTALGFFEIVEEFWNDNTNNFTVY